MDNMKYDKEHHSPDKKHCMGGSQARLDKDNKKKQKELKREIRILNNNPKRAERMGLSSEGQGGKDYEAIADKERQLKELNNKK